MEETKNSNSAKQKKLEEIQKRLAEIQSKSSDQKIAATKTKATATRSSNKKNTTVQPKQPDSASTPILDSKSKSSAPRQPLSNEKESKPKSGAINKSVPTGKEPVANDNSKVTAPSKSTTTSKKTDNIVDQSTEVKQPQTADSKWKENNVRKQATVENKKNNETAKKPSRSDEPKKKSNSKAIVIISACVIVLLLALLYVWQFTELFNADKTLLSENTKTTEEPRTEDVKQHASLLEKGQIIISYSSNENELTAISNVQQLSAKGHNAAYFWIPSLFDKGASLYKVYTGPYTSIEEATKQLQVIQQIREDAYLLKAPIENL